jgi:hypothetical protein
MQPVRQSPQNGKNAKHAMDVILKGNGLRLIYRKSGSGRNSWEFMRLDV